MGMLGSGSEADALTPTRVQDGGVRFAAVCAGSTHTCALAETGEAYCFGLNDLGQLVSWWNRWRGVH